MPSLRSRPWRRDPSKLASGKPGAVHFGMRQSRYIGLAKTGLQEVCTAAAINVSRVVRWLDGAPRAKTRVTRFAALAQAA
jgi:transposase